MVYQLKNKKDIIKHLADFLLSEKVYKELGEPILYSQGDVFWVKGHKGEIVGFCCVSFEKSSAVLKYIYVKEKWRGNGFFTELYTEAESFTKDMQADIIKATCTKSALPIYLNIGFEVKKSWVNYHNIFKTLT